MLGVIFTAICKPSLDSYTLYISRDATSYFLIELIFVDRSGYVQLISFLIT